MGGWGGGGGAVCTATMQRERERDWPSEVERERDGSAWTCVSDMYQPQVLVQELCESRGGRPVLSVLTSLLVSVDVKLY